MAFSLFACLLCCLLALSVTSLVSGAPSTKGSSLPSGLRLVAKEGKVTLVGQLPVAAPISPNVTLSPSSSSKVTTPVPPTLPLLLPPSLRLHPSSPPLGTLSTTTEVPPTVVVNSTDSQTGNSGKEESTVTVASRVTRANARQHYCGRSLTEVLRIVCRSFYYSGNDTNSSSTTEGTILPRSRNSSRNATEVFNKTEAVPLAEGAPVGASPLEVTSSFTVEASSDREEEESATMTAVMSEDGAPLPTVKRRPIRGIVDECCYRPCSLNDLQMYCSITTTVKPGNVG